MVETVTPDTKQTPEAGAAAVTPPVPRRPSGHRGADVRDTVAEMAARAQEISLEAGSKIAAAMKDVINAAAGVTGFATESARDLVQYMIRRGQMTQDEGEKLLREAEDANSKRPASTKMPLRTDAARTTETSVKSAPSAVSSPPVSAAPAREPSVKPAPAPVPVAKAATAPVPVVKQAPAIKAKAAPARAVKPAAKKPVAKKPSSRPAKAGARPASKSKPAPPRPKPKVKPPAAKKKKR